MPAIKTPRGTLLASIRPGTWIAISQNQERVVGKGRTSREALRKAKQNGEESPFITRVPKQSSALIL